MWKPFLRYICFSLLHPCSYVNMSLMSHRKTFPKFWKRGEIPQFKCLIQFQNGSGIYYIEYWLQSPGESRRYLYSAIGMASNGWYNRLYTVTGQVCGLIAIHKIHCNIYNYVFCLILLMHDAVCGRGNRQICFKSSEGEFVFFFFK